MRFSLRHIDLRLGLALCAVTAGCESSVSPDTGPTLIRFVNAAHDAVGPLRFTLADGPSALVQQAQSSAYAAVEPRVYPVLIEDDIGGWSVGDDLQIVRGLHQTLVAFGTSDNEAGILVGDEPAAAPSGQFLARFLHLAPGVSGAIDIHIVMPGGSLDENTLARSDIIFPSSVDYFRVSAGSWRIVLTPAATTDVLLDSGELTFGSREAYTILILTAEDGAPGFLRLRDGE